MTDDNYPRTDSPVDLQLPWMMENAALKHRVQALRKICGFWFGVAIVEAVTILVLAVN